MKSVSVIIPTYNRSATLTRALDSVMRQSVAADEIIVVDDGSSDGTADLVKDRYPGVTLIVQKNHGVSHARNRGIESASADWIALLDSDDEWLENKLETQLASIEPGPEHLLIHTDEIWIRDGQRVNQMEKHRKHGGYIFQKCLPLCAISPSSSLIHRSIFEKIGLFDESLPACEDYDFWLRVCAQYPVRYIDEPLIIKHGGHDDQLSGKHWGMDRFRIRSLARVINEVSLPEDDRRAAINTLMNKIEIYLNGADKHGNSQHVTEFRQLAEQFS